MPKDNEVDEKVKPVAWIVTNGGESCEPWLEYEQSEVDALPAVCIAEPLYSAAEVERLEARIAELTDMCRTMLPVFEAARPLVLNLERLRDAAKGRSHDHPR